MSGQNRPDNLGKFLLTEAFPRKHLKEECCSEVKQQLSFKYFVNFHFTLKLFSKVMRVADDTIQSNSECEWVNHWANQADALFMQTPSICLIETSFLFGLCNHINFLKCITV